jgi:hypothetical protein
VILCWEIAKTRKDEIAKAKKGAAPREPHDSPACYRFAWHFRLRRAIIRGDEAAALSRDEAAGRHFA